MKHFGKLRRNAAAVPGITPASFSAEFVSNKYIVGTNLFYNHLMFKQSGCRRRWKDKSSCSTVVSR
jgi:hypothetical protein